MKLKSVILGFVISVVIILLILFIMALLTYFTGISDSVTNVCVYIGMAFGVLLGAFFAAKSSGKKPLFNAMAVSIVCIAFLIILSLVMNGKIDFNMHFVAALIGCLLAGFFGAVIGK